MKLTIITPCYEAGDYLIELHNNIKKQLTNECEWIIVDDGSGEYTRSILTKFPANERISVVYQPNKGACAARNTGINVSKGKYLLFVDADDLLSESAISIFLDYIEKATRAQSFVAKSASFTGNHRDLNFGAPHGNLEKDKIERSPLLFFLSPNTHHSACIFPAEQVKMIGGWDDNLLADQDGDFLRRYFLNHPTCLVINQTLHFWRQHEGSNRISTNNSNSVLLSRLESLTKFAVILQNKKKMSFHIYIGIMRLYLRLFLRTYEQSPLIGDHVFRHAAHFALGRDMDPFLGQDRPANSIKPRQIAKLIYLLGKKVRKIRGL